ncbi:cobalamin-binding protein [Aliterella atlantica]|uniref:ABC transporter substrate-binding protein n=1 Tax=Aliterella atlantica CENA595 TaxID=1618023 RepID=A0A0D8ZV92_9CYAN|nr:cobalamin-binding protein [Aliterella atlantica]KJH72292.1 ABC transporter substrate-binding protein [Aliterella atlantica CENA595]
MSDRKLKIVSLLPSATEIVAALGLTEALVGRSHECDYPPEIQALPVCTQARLNSQAPSKQIDEKVNEVLQSALSIYEIKTDILQQLAPTHILTQDQCEVCAVSLQDVEQAIGKLTDSSPKIISLQPNIIADLWSDIERVADELGVESNRLVEDLAARVKICQQKTEKLSAMERPSVACIEWTDPLMIAANWIPELVMFAGGQPLFASSGQNSPKLDWETLVATDPDAIIFMPCGFDIERTRTESMTLCDRPKWQSLKAVHSGRVYITDGNAYFNRPGPRLVDSVEILAEILHPEIFAYSYRGKGWERLE